MNGIRGARKPGHRINYSNANYLGYNGMQRAWPILTGLGYSNGRRQRRLGAARSAFGVGGIGGIGGYPGLGGLGGLPWELAASVDFGGGYPGLGGGYPWRSAVYPGIGGFGTRRAWLRWWPWAVLAGGFGGIPALKQVLAVVGLGLSVWQPTTDKLLSRHQREKTALPIILPKLLPQLLQGPGGLNLAAAGRWPPGRTIFSTSRMIASSNDALCPMPAAARCLQHRAGPPARPAQGSAHRRSESAESWNNRAGDRDLFAACPYSSSPPSTSR